MATRIMRRFNCIACVYSVCVVVVYRYIFIMFLLYYMSPMFTSHPLLSAPLFIPASCLFPSPSPSPLALPLPLWQSKMTSTLLFDEV